MILSISQCLSICDRAAQTGLLIYLSEDGTQVPLGNQYSPPAGVAMVMFCYFISPKCYIAISQLKVSILIRLHVDGGDFSGFRTIVEDVFGCWGRVS